MRKSLRRILERLRVNVAGRGRKPTAARDGLQQPQRMQAVPVRTRTFGQK
jgi:hypothetical protein